MEFCTSPSKANVFKSHYLRIEPEEGARQGSLPQWRRNRFDRLRFVFDAGPLLGHGGGLKIEN